ncbi:MAG: hypothetical protein M3P83_01795 [Actinomycetota bacterium]|nr:hypothetical protein [Actinomycetota bacterium]
MTEHFTEDLALLRDRALRDRGFATRPSPPPPTPHRHRRHVARALRRVADRLDG